MGEETAVARVVSVEPTQQLGGDLGPWFPKLKCCLAAGGAGAGRTGVLELFWGVCVFKWPRLLSSN